MHENDAHPPELTPEDRRLLDALVENGFDLDALALDGEERRRAEAVMSLMGLLDDYPSEDTDETIVDATLARIDRHERERSARMTFDAAAEPARGRRIRLPDFVTIAAVVLIGSSIVIPVLHNMRARAIDQRCANNMRLLGYAFGNYAADHDGELPIAVAGLSGWTRGFEHVLNLAPLVDGDYCEVGHLNCAGHADEPGSSYSYQWISADARPTWGTGRSTVILGDRNPVIDGLRSGRPTSPGALSVNHRGRGQNVLSSDGATLWLEQSEIGQGDNIWLPDGMETLRDGATTTRPGDVFLAH